MKTLAQFKEEWLGRNLGMDIISHCKCETYRDVQYLIALEHTNGYGWSAIHVERKDEIPLDDNEVNIGAFGETYGDCIDSLFWC